jgi:poly(3-hydroxybutyrate) depolymerase
MCGYFDDLNLGEGLAVAAQEGWLSSDEVDIVAEFHRLADAYEPPSGGDPAVLQDARWSHVVRAAQAAWLALRRVDADATERELMDELEKRWGRISVGPI